MTDIQKSVLEAGPEKAGKEYYEKIKQMVDNNAGTSPEKAAKLVSYLMSKRAQNLSGKTLSAVWDPYEDFSDIDALNQSSIFSFKRVVDLEGGTRPKG